MRAMRNVHWVLQTHESLRCFQLMHQTASDIKIRMEALILIIILHTFLHQKDVFAHQRNDGTDHVN